MTIRRLINEQVGGLIPLVGHKREVFAVDGVQHRVWLTWFGRSWGADYHTPRYPRDIRCARAAVRERYEQAERQRRRDIAREALARVWRSQVGDVIPDWVPEIPDHVLEVRDSQFDVWRRPADDSERIYEGQAYDWVQATRDGEIAGWTTNEGLRDHSPLTVTAVAVDHGDARNAA